MKFAAKYGMLKQMHEIKQDRDIVFTAIDTLKTSDGIEQFLCEYCEWLSESGATEEVRNDACNVANKNIGFALGHYSAETNALWFGVLRSIEHPWFGRRTDITAEEAFNMGMQMGEQMRKDADKK